MSQYSYLRTPSLVKSSHYRLIHCHPAIIFMEGSPEICKSTRIYFHQRLNWLVVNNHKEFFKKKKKILKVCVGKSIPE